MDIKRRLLALVALTTLLVSCGGQSEAPLVAPQLLPLPQSYTLGDGAYHLAQSVTTDLDTSTPAYALLQEVLHGHTLTISSEGTQAEIRYTQIEGLGDEQYRLTVDATGVQIESSTPEAILLALQTLRQLTDEHGRVHYAQIDDSPRFGYRGVMLDVSRHMVSTSYIKRLLDEMARVKLNRFHWHLVDGGGWRMEVESYPKLMTHSTYRTESDWDKWWHTHDRTFTTKDAPGAYGGYYTKEEIREIVAYASARGITIIPEIEMPGHSNEIFDAYPELFCRDHNDGHITDVCIGSEATFTFFEKILDETMELFPSQYIHIGGDEAAMNHWGSCPRCQARMRSEGLKSLHELQSYMIRRIERYLISKGRKLIGWDEILMGGLAPDATVMSWRGEAGGVEAAKAGHDVIMTPNDYLYLDYYQSATPDHPRTIGGYVPLEKTYSYDPHSDKLTPEEQRHILGVQGNMWTEYAESEDHVSYMLFPRMLALAEIAWSPREARDYDSFCTRATSYVEQLRARGFNAYELTGITTDIHPTTDGKSVSLTITPERRDVEVRYTLDGTDPTASSTLYTEPLVTEGMEHVRVNVFRSGEALHSTPINLRYARHYGLDGTISYVHPWNARYPAGGARALIDGVRGTPTYLDGKWQGFTTPLDVTIDLGQERTLSEVFAQFMQEREQWVYMPGYVEVWISKDGTEWTSLGRQTTTTDERNPRPVFETFSFATTAQARYVRLYAANDRSEGHFIFTDEITIR